MPNAQCLKAESEELRANIVQQILCGAPTARALGPAFLLNAIGAPGAVL
jgi:hypothetical protein